MHVFIDTNILLGLYKLSGPDLDELKKVMKLAEKGKLKIRLNEHVRDEFWRNRESVIEVAMEQFVKGKGSQLVPNLLRPYPQASELLETLGKAAKLINALKDQAETDIRTNSLKADEVVQQLFATFGCASVAPAIIERAQLRRDLGNPPGKQNSLGDAINWEWLLDAIDASTTLHIITSDGDYESDLHASEPREFLRREWAQAKKANLELYKSLPEFLGKHFPNIKLLDEIEKSVAIDKLQTSWSFQATHHALSELKKCDDFSDEDLRRLLQAYTANTQIHWILGDADVRSFAEKLVKLAKGEALKEYVVELQNMLDQLDEKPSMADVVWTEDGDTAS